MLDDDHVTAIYSNRICRSYGKAESMDGWRGNGNRWGDCVEPRDYQETIKGLSRDEDGGINYALQLAQAGSAISSRPAIEKFAGFFRFSSLVAFSLSPTRAFLLGEDGGCLVSLAWEIFKAVWSTVN